ncbi:MULTISPECIES: EAL domain-containing protein [Paraburkholderia]|uniref:EAL domain-containing protein n=1 Tax=Paraburkholderia TaxID=1822464 RepID=UPI002252614C|nr:MULTISPECIES: EAL domain-containing protein [Paraburkholderia]MCX4175478.1 EAL domain-containing protein [Paraburkholderia madseniana]MDQ6463475.1 EAL domain-containing protein [Paraburkholderia madseniana]
MTSHRLPEYRPAHRGDAINSAIVSGTITSVFEEVARLAATICEVPIAAVTLPDPDSSWLHSDVGLSAEEWTAAEAAFCLLVAGDHQAVEVVDAADDPRVAQNPFIFGTLEIRFYANTPILLPMGQCIGVLSVAACEPQRLTHMQRAALDSLAHIVSTCLLNPTAGALADAPFGKGFNLNTAPEPKTDLVVLASSSGEIGYVSDASARYMDGSSSRLAGANLLDTVADEDRASVAAALRDVVTRRLGATLVARMSTINNVERWVRWNYRPVTDIDGRIVAIHAVGRDVSERRRAEQALIESERRYRELYERTPAMLHSIDVQGRLISVSDLWLRTLGYDRVEVLGRPSSDFLTPASREYARQVVLPEFFRTGHCRNVEYEMVRKDGEVIDVLLSAFLERQSDGVPWRSMAVIEDITERRKVEATLLESERRYRALFEHMQVGFVLLDIVSDATAKVVDFRFVAANPAIARTSHIPSDLMIGRKVSEVFAGLADLEWDWLGTLTGVVLTGEPVARQDIPTAADGWFDMVAYRPGPNQCAVLVLETTERKRMQATLAEQHEFLQITLHSIGDGVVTTDPHGRVTYLNPVAERLTGWLIAQARGLPLDDVFDARNESTRVHAPNPVTQCLSENRVVGNTDNTVLISRSGAEHAIKDSAAPIVSAIGEVLGVVLVFHDVTEERRLTKEMSYRATHDALTGLLNRAEFETQLNRVLIHAREAGSKHAMLYIDLDQFKVVNDTFGHIAGDQLLRQVTEQVGQCIRATDTLARLGGDEFGVILEQCDTEQARRVASQICERLDEFRFAYNERRFHIGASIGLVPIDERWPTTAAVLQAADNACYAAKDAGRNRVHSWFDADQAVIARHGEMQWVTRLEQALDEDRFELYAQRIRALGQQENHLRCELLLRLRESDGTLVLPDVFLSAAERFHMASRIDRWVVKCVFAWMTHHRDQLDHVDSIAVNLSGQSIGDHAFHRYVRDLADSFQFDTHKLCFEVTETAAITNLSVATEFVQSLRLRGMHFALDDFGSGASSFGYLKALPVDYLKIDGQFITNLEHDPIDQAMVRCICDVAKAVGKQTIAEFVETAAVAALLRDMGADYIQGYFVHVPAPMEEVLLRGVDTRS